MAQFLLILVVAGLLAWVNWAVGLARLRRELDAKALPMTDPTLAGMIRRLGEAAGAPPIEVRLWDMNVVNGLATPDGRVFLTTALYEKYRLGLLKAEEVASVAAHEIGHVALGHHRRRLIDWTGQSVAKLALGLLLNRIVPIIGFYIANAIGALIMLRLSRRDEFEADRYATALMIRAGLGHAPQIAMFRKLERMVPGPKGAAWMASHPPVPERVAAIEANAKAWSAGAQSPASRTDA
jgi:putative metalloprotease